MTARLVTPAWLADHLADPDVRVLDATVHLTFDADGAHVESGLETFREGYVPGAGFVDQITELTDPDADVPFTVAPSERFAAALGALGVGDGTTVVVYDRANGIWATRLWWQLGLEGFDDVAVLDGGLDAWTAAGLELEPGDAAPREARTFTATRRPERIVGTQDVAAALDDPASPVVCALGRETYEAAHIPGSGNVGFDVLVNADGTYRSPEELRTLLDDAGLLAPGTRPVTYCGGGIAATSLTFALSLVGQDDVAVYDGSLSAWTADPARPVAAG